MAGPGAGLYGSLVIELKARRGCPRQARAWRM